MEKEKKEQLIISLKEKREKLFGIKFRRLIHPLLLNVMTKMRDFDLKPVDGAIENQRLMEETIQNGPVIFAINHSNVHDVPTSGEIIKEHCYLLASDEVRGSFNGFLFETMGVVWTKRDPNGKDRIEKSPLEHMLSLLENGVSIKTFPERTWNVSDNEIIYPFKWGDVKISQLSGRPIIPIVMDYDYAEGICYYNIGKPVTVSKDENLIEANDNLRDKMATLRYNIWEIKRDKIIENGDCPSAEEYRQRIIDEWDNYKKTIKKEYPSFDEETEKSMVYRRTTTKEEAFEHLKKLTPNHKNAFLFDKRNLK